jgi:hypothetical protein
MGFSWALAGIIVPMLLGACWAILGIAPPKTLLAAGLVLIADLGLAALTLLWLVIWFRLASGGAAIKRFILARNKVQKSTPAPAPKAK